MKRLILLLLLFLVVISSSTSVFADDINSTISTNENCNDLSVENIEDDLISPNMAVSIDNISYEGDMDIVVKLPVNATGTLTPTINANLFPTKDVNTTGINSISIVEFSANNYSVIVDYSGEDKYSSQTVIVNMAIDKVTPDLDININDCVYGQNLTVTVNVSNKSTGNITYFINGTKKGSSKINDGISKINITNLDAGTYNLTVVFDGDNNFNKATNSTTFIVSKANCTFELNGTRLILPSDAKGNVSIYLNGEFSENLELVNGEVNFKIEHSGSYILLAIYQGDNNYNPVKDTFSANFRSNVYIIKANPIIKYYAQDVPLKIALTNGDGLAIVNRNVTIIVNNITYIKQTNMTGEISFGIYLRVGYYPIIVSYNNTSVNTSATIKSTINGSNIIKYFANGTHYSAKFISSNGSPLANSDIKFNINGIVYNKKTDNQGVAGLSIYLKPGNYTITAYSPNGDASSNNITVLSILKGSNIVKYYINGTHYHVTVLDGNGNPLANAKVTFNINGVLYEKTTNSSGIASLGIYLSPKDYIITTIYNGLFMSNNIKVLPTILSEDLSMYSDARVPFVVTVLDGNGKQIAGQDVTFNINGVFYNRISDNDGKASLDIGLRPNDYKITISYNYLLVSNNISIYPDSISNNSRISENSNSQVIIKQSD